MGKWYEGMPTDTYFVRDIGTNHLSGVILNVEAIGETHREFIEQDDLDEIFDDGLDALLERRQFDFWKGMAIKKLLEEKKIEVRLVDKRL